MDAFSEIVALYLETHNYWVRKCVKLENVTKADKRAFGLPTMPRPEIDLVAFDMRNNELVLVEAKSFLDSYGVWFEVVSNPKVPGAERYKLFTNEPFRRIVSQRIKDEYLQQGLINVNTKVTVGLAAGHIHSPRDEVRIQKHFSKNGWRLFAPQQIKGYVNALADKGWEDSLVTIASKLINRRKFGRKR
ncbi:MAG: hypothetical protein HY673_03425 [Chloroflexi bacterium]|nr:hypothetical protein [Chloroflexota bacterium]